MYLGGETINHGGGIFISGERNKKLGGLLKKKREGERKKEREAYSLTSFLSPKQTVTASSSYVWFWPATSW